MEFQNKFKLLYGYDSSSSSDMESMDDDGNAVTTSKNKKDPKFRKMKHEFERLQNDLQNQRQSLIEVVEKVNRLIRHHGYEVNDNKALKMKAKAAQKMGGKPKPYSKQFEEDKTGGSNMEEEKRSFRGVRDEMNG